MQRLQTLRFRVCKSGPRLFGRDTELLTGGMRRQDASNRPFTSIGCADECGGAGGITGGIITGTSPGTYQGWFETPLLQAAPPPPLLPCRRDTCVIQYAHTHTHK